MPRASQSSLWHNHAALWEDLAAGFPEFRHLGVDFIQDGKPESRYTEPFSVAVDGIDSNDD